MPMIAQQFFFLPRPPVSLRRQRRRALINSSVSQTETSDVFIHPSIFFSLPASIALNYKSEEEKNRKKERTKSLLIFFILLWRAENFRSAKKAIFGGR